MESHSNTVPYIRRFVTNELGENYWFGGCGRYVMGALGETQYDYLHFAGLTGDVFAQAYAGGKFWGDCVTDYRMHDPDAGAFIEGIFHRCGYASVFVPETELRAHWGQYLQKLMSSIDRGVPVISNLFLQKFAPWAVLVGYENQGKILLYMTDNMTKPAEIPAAQLLSPPVAPPHPAAEAGLRGWLFIEEKVAEVPCSQLYRDRILTLPALLTEKTDKYCFGAAAFRAWAEDVAAGKGAENTPAAFDAWFIHGTYVCNCATNACCCHEFLQRVMDLCPEMGFLRQVSALYRQMEGLWHGAGDSLEALGGGLFNLTLETLQNKERRERIAAKIQEMADVADEILDVLQQGIKTLK